jgi:hypothetical protein
VALAAAAICALVYFRAQHVQRARFVNTFSFLTDPCALPPITGGSFAVEPSRLQEG